MAEGNETSPVTSDATPVVVAISGDMNPGDLHPADLHPADLHPGDLHPSITAIIEGPKVESPAIQSSIVETPLPAEPLTAVIPEPTPVVDVAPIAAVMPMESPVTETSKIETSKIEPRMPVAAALAEPEIKAAPTSEPTPALPPPFLREHATRVITAKPPLRGDARGPEVRPPQPKPTGAKPAPKVERAPRQGKFAVLAASVAILACVGSALGSVGIATLAHLPTTGGTRPDAVAEVRALREQIAQLGTDLAATRANLEHLNRNTGAQFGKLAERLDKSDRAQSERAQIDPTAKLAKITESLERLEKRVAMMPVTPTPVAAVTPPPAPAAQNDVTGSVTPRPAPEPKATPKPQPQILESFVLRQVYDGVAVVEGRMGVIELVPGQPLPGGGRVEDIKRQDGRWVVITTKGLIVSQRDR